MFINRLLRLVLATGLAGLLIWVLFSGLPLLSPRSAYAQTALSAFVQISAGGEHICGLTDANEIKCWGANYFGQLGNGNTLDQAQFTSVISLSAQPTLIDGGQMHTCVRLTTGRIQCWGSGGFGELGNGTLANSSVPVSVTTIVSNVVEVAAGSSYTCARLTTGQAMCWGANQSGNLGNGQISNNQNIPVFVSGLTNATQLVAGSSHACAVTASGGLLCWGSNNYGQLGLSATGPISVPVSVFASGVSKVYAGAAHMCATFTNDEVKCWGYNATGQLGDGTTTSHYTPTNIINLNNVDTLALGLNHTCAMKVGNVWCWGSNNNGQLGTGDFANSSVPVSVVGLPKPAIAVTVGFNFSCALLTDQSVYCWGAATRGQRGDGTLGYSAVPTSPVNAPAAYSITVGGFHTCLNYPLNLAPQTTAVCWGANSYGQLGDATQVQKLFPTTTVQGLNVNGNLQLSAGGFHTCAVLPNGTVQCWGANYFGQLGTGSLSSATTPVTVTAITSTTQVSAGLNHTCAILASEQLQCWGYNVYGQLGIGSTQNYSVPVTITTLANPPVQVASGQEHTCAVLNDTSLQCWGRNQLGQLGDETQTNSNIPVQVGGGLDNNVTRVAVGGASTCALRTNATVWCWGSNSLGQIGTGLSQNVITSPTPISGTLPALIDVTVGRAHACTLTQGGDVWCWGDNQYGQLGNGLANNASSKVPVKTVGNFRASAIAAGSDHTCALLTNQTTVCWGRNYEGQLGTNTPVYSASPQYVLASGAPNRLFLPLIQR